MGKCLFPIGWAEQAPSVPNEAWGANPSSPGLWADPRHPGATAWLRHCFPRLFTEAEAREIRNTTFRDVLAAVTSGNLTDFQSNVFVWRQGECCLQCQGEGANNTRLRCMTARSMQNARVARVESGLKSRHLHCTSPGRIPRYKRCNDAPGGCAGVKAWPLPTPCCVMLLTDVSFFCFHIHAHTGLQVKREQPETQRSSVDDLSLAYHSCVTLPASAFHQLPGVG